MTMQRLRSYVRRTMLEKARDYAGGKRRTPESTKTAFIDALRGTDTGWWSGMIYTWDMLKKFNRYRSEIRNIVLDLVSKTGCNLGDPAEHGKEALTYAEMVASTGRRQTWERYTNDNDRIAREAAAALLALRVAVEYLAGEIARELYPDL